MKDLKKLILPKLHEYAQVMDQNLTEEESLNTLNLLQRIFIELNNYLTNLPEELKKLTIQLMNKGWYVSISNEDFITYSELEQNLIGKNSSIQDKYLMTYFDVRSNDIERVLLNSFPNRENQIQQAFHAYRAKLYYLSIPALLILAESICRDLAGNIDLYGKHKPKSEKEKKPLTDDLFDQIYDIDPFEQILFYPLRNRTNLTKSIKNPSSYEKTLFNRHLIIHGQSDNYGTEINNIKSLSLVAYVFYTLDYLRER